MSVNRQKEYSHLLADVFKGNVKAVEFCLQLNALSQIIDDLIDKDAPVSDKTIFCAFHTALFEIQENEFYFHNIHRLKPVLKSAYIAWFDSSRLEKENAHPEDRRFSYVLRDQLIDVTIACAQIIGGTSYAVDKSITLRRFWTHQESYGQYLKELEG